MCVGGGKRQGRTGKGKGRGHDTARCALKLPQRTEHMGMRAGRLCERGGRQGQEGGERN